MILLARERVFKYVIERFGITITGSVSLSSPLLVQWSKLLQSTKSPGASVKDIRSLKDQKKPETAIQMAALVAYYLQEVAVGDEKKDSVGVSDIQTYFKQAGFALPKVPKSALINAKTAGYLESAGYGSYKLNPVGYNLVVHGLPAKSGGGSKNAKRPSKKPKSKKKK